MLAAGAEAVRLNAADADARFPMDLTLAAVGPVLEVRTKEVKQSPGAPPPILARVEFTVRRQGAIDAMRAVAERPRAGASRSGERGVRMARLNVDERAGVGGRLPPWRRRIPWAAYTEAFLSLAPGPARSGA